MKNKKSVYTLGPKGSFHDLSCTEYLGGQQEIEFSETFSGIFEAVRAGHLGWIALNNSKAGLVEHHENEITKNFMLLDEMDYEVNLCVCARHGTTLKDIEVIYSHDKALKESKRFIIAELSKVTAKQSPSTSKAALQVAQQNMNNVAAICHAKTAKFYGLDIIATIPNKGKNETTFALFSR